MLSKIKGYSYNLHEFSNNLNEYLNRVNPFLLSLFVTLFSISSYFIFVGQPIWGTNDDVGMAMMASGVWLSDYPSSDIMFMHYYYGWFISRLVNVQPNIPWYGLSFLFIISLSQLVLSYSIFRIKKTNPLFGLVCAFNLSVIVLSYSHLQFTIVAGLVTLAGYGLLLSLLNNEPKNKFKFFFATSIAISLIIMGELIRFESMILVSMLLIPFGLIVLWFNKLSKTNKKEKLKFIIKLTIIGLISFISLTMIFYQNQKHINESTGWKKWYRLNQLKSEFIDYKKIKYNNETQSIFEKVHWNEAHFNMIMAWQYNDPKVFNLEKFEYVVKTIGNEGLSDEKTEVGVFSLLRILLHSIKNTPISVNLLLILTVLILPFSRKNLLIILFIFLSITSIFLYLYIGLSKIPYRVLILLPTSALVMLILSLALNDLNDNINKKFNYLKIGLVFLISIYSYEYFSTNKIVKQNIIAEKKLNEKLIAWSKNLPKNAIVYSIGSEFDYESHLPLKTFKSFKKVPNFISAGCSNQSPHMFKILKKQGLNENFYKELAKKENVYFVKRNFHNYNDKKIQALSKYYRIFHGLELSFKTDKRLPDLYRVFFNKRAIS